MRVERIPVVEVNILRFEKGSEVTVETGRLVPSKAFWESLPTEEEEQQRARCKRAVVNICIYLASELLFVILISSLVVLIVWSERFDLQSFLCFFFLVLLCFFSF